MDMDRLVDTEQGLISGRTLIEPRDLRRGATADLRAALAVLCHDSQIRSPAISYHLYGRGPGAGGARQRRPGQRLSQCLPPSRQPPVSRRRRQRRHFFTAGPTAMTGGSLRALSQGSYHGQLERDRWGLTPVAQWTLQRASVSHLDPEAPPLREYLGETCWYLRTPSSTDARAASRLSRPTNGLCRATGSPGRELWRRRLPRALESWGGLSRRGSASGLPRAGE